MWLMARELQGPHVRLLIPCPSSAANKNKVRLKIEHCRPRCQQNSLVLFFITDTTVLIKLEIQREEKSKLSITNMGQAEVLRSAVLLKIKNVKF